MGRLGELSELHRWMWAGEEGVKFHRQAEYRFKKWWLPNHSAIVAPFRDAMRSCGVCTTLCEIGSGSGLVLQDLSQRLPEIGQLIGLDLSREQTEHNRNRFRGNPRLRFEAGDATSWVARHAKPGWAYFTNAGVLEYFSEEQLSMLLSEIAASMRPAVFALIEPVPKDYDFARELKSRPYNFEKSLGHNYFLWLGTSGWHVTYYDEIELANCRFVMVVATAPA